MTTRPAQLFTQAGQLVATADVPVLTGDERWPSAVSFEGKIYVLDRGRYVEAAGASEVTEATRRS